MTLKWIVIWEALRSEELISHESKHHEREATKTKLRPACGSGRDYCFTNLALAWRCLEMLIEMGIRRTAVHRSKYCWLLSPLSLVAIGTPEILSCSDLFLLSRPLITLPSLGSASTSIWRTLTYSFSSSGSYNSWPDTSCSSLHSHEIVGSTHSCPWVKMDQSRV